MKFFVIFAMIFCAVNGFRFKDIFTHHTDISPHNECAGQPNGMRLPHLTNCQQFILCDGGVGLTLSCRTSEPNFNRCNQRCETDPYVCTITDCNGGGGPTDPSPTDPSPTDPSPTDPTSPSSTTGFTPPTVPVTCPDPCVESNRPDTCDCIERWTCVNAVCQCNVNIPCPMTSEACLAKPDCGGENGCADRCVCDGDNCLCDTTIECGFPQTECAARCGCAGNCACVDSANCVCNEVCTCIEPPLICPFAREHCIERCGCEARCLCNGNVCTCDPDNRCPARNVFWSRF